MKLTKSKLRQIIKEELGRVLNERDTRYNYGSDPTRTLATAMWTFMRDIGMKMHVSKEGAINIGSHLVDAVKQAEAAIDPRTGEESGDPGDLYRKIYLGDPTGKDPKVVAKTKLDVMHRRNIQDLLRQLSKDRVFKVDDDKWIIMRRGEDGAVIGNKEAASQHATSW